MKKFVTTFTLVILLLNAHSQQKKIDSLKHFIAKAKDDTGKVMSMCKLGAFYSYSKPDSALDIGQSAYLLSKNIQFLHGQTKALSLIGIAFDLKGNYPKAISSYLTALKIAEQMGDKDRAAKLLVNIGMVNYEQDDFRQAVAAHLKVKQMVEAAHNEPLMLSCFTNLGLDYIGLKMPDSALIYTDEAYRLAIKLSDKQATGISALNLGVIYSAKRQFNTALPYFRKAIPMLQQLGDDFNLCEAMIGMVDAFRQTGQGDSLLRYGRQAMAIGRHGNFPERILTSSQMLTTYFKAHGELDSAFHYQEIAITAKDSLFSQQKNREIQNLIFAERRRQQEIQEKEAAQQANIRYYLMSAVIMLLLIMAFIFWRNSRLRKKANHLLHIQNDEIGRQKKGVETALNELKITQNQLVQREKMASLGELTSGIAHEIQNPLNFVNNFSEVNAELIDEMEEEIDNGNFVEAKAITADIKANQKKISHHGKRADFIIKGMLEHTRTGTGERTTTNVNMLADEFLKLSYHGLRAKYNSLSATIVTNFDNNIPNVALVQQDIGRVLLNLFNNAFYAVNEKQKTAGAAYKPEISVTTYLENNHVAIKVKDNGTGIPDAIKEKIMQPFFTTKPTGEGTGLGLSLSYDIIVKGHGGKIEVNSKEGEGSEFIITF